LADTTGKPLTGVVGVTFSLYTGQQDGSPLWMETENVRPDKNGRYTVMLGSSTSQGVPANLFAAGEARWLGVRSEGQAEQPRVMLISVPYALKALDAETIGGKPASSFMLAAPASANGVTAGSGTPLAGTIMGGGTKSFVPRFTGTRTIGNSNIFEATTGNVGIGTTQPSAKLDINGSFSAASIGANYAALNDISNGQAILALSSVPNAITIYGQASSTTGTGYGIKGVTQSNDPNAVGVYGFAAAGNAKGVTGFAESSAGNGVYAQLVNPSSTGQAVFPAAGVWGDTGVQNGTAVLGTADDGVALAAYNNSNVNTTVLFDDLDPTNPNSAIVTTYGSGFQGQCFIDVSGDLYCSGSKSSVVPVDGGARKVALYAIEGPENWFEDAGGGQLVNGSAIVELESTFAQTVNTSIDYRVFLTPNGDCKGLYVTQKSPTSFEVHELGGGTANIAFDYRIMAKRKGYENIRLADKTKQFEIPKLPRRAASSQRPSAKPAISRLVAAPRSQPSQSLVHK
jgi:hypothetical protein